MKRLPLYGIICIVACLGTQEFISTHAASSYSISIQIEDGSITSSKLSSMNARDMDLLAWHQKKFIWQPLSLLIYNPIYQGTWNAGTGSAPDDDPERGDFYFVAERGNTILDDTSVWNIGDWALFDGEEWRKVENSLVVTSVFGRTGDVVIEDNDYIWNQFDMSGSSIGDMADVYIEGTPEDYAVLGWSDVNERWEVFPPLISDGSITELELASESINSSKIANGAISNVHVNVGAGIDYSKLNFSDGDLSISQTFGLQTTLDDKLVLTGGTFAGAIDMSNNDFVDIGNIDGYDLADIEASVAANRIRLDSIETADVAENASTGGLYYTDERVKTAAVENNIIDNIVIVAPSQDAVYTGLLGKLDVLGEDVDLFANSITTAAKGGVNIRPYGTGASETGQVHLHELQTNGTEYVGFRAPDSIDSSITFTLPATSGIYGDMLTTDGSKNLVWVPLGTGGTALIRVSATSPLISSEGMTPNISMYQASSTSGGYVVYTDWNTFNEKQNYYPSLSTIAGLATDSGNFIVADGSTWTKEATPGVRTTLNLNNVENVALSTWPGTTNLTTLGTISTGVWHGATMGVEYMPEGGNWALTSNLNINSNALVIASDGNVGVGVATPTAKLDVGGALIIDSVGLKLQADTDIDGADSLRLQAIGANSAGAFTVMPSGTSSQSAINLYNSSSTINVGVLKTSVNGNTFQISTTAFGGGSEITKAQFEGNLGIGMTEPNEKLTVDGVMSFAEINEPASSAGNGKIYVDQIDSKLYFKDSAGVISDMSDIPDDMGNHTATQKLNLAGFKLVKSPGTTGISIDGTGNVGIGENTPSAPLDIKNGLFLGKSSDAATASDILFETQGLIATETNMYLNFGSIGGVGDLYIGKDTETSAALNLVTVKKDGNVGVGISSPNEILTVEGVLAFVEVAATPTVTSGFGKLFVNSADGRLYHVDDAGYADDLTLEPDDLGDHTATQNLDLATYKLVGNHGSNGISIDVNGNVGIKTVSPADKLHVYGDVKLDDGSNPGKISVEDSFMIFRSDSAAGIVLEFETKTTDPNPNYLKVVNADQGLSPQLTVDGNDANISMNIDAKGGGEVHLATTTGNVGIDSSPDNEILTVEGAVSFVETTSPLGGTTNYGKVYVKSRDPSPGADIFFMDENGIESNLRRRLITTIYEKKGYDVEAGAAVGDTVYTRDLTEIEGDNVEMGVTLDSTSPGKFTLTKIGTYSIRWRAPVFAMGKHISWLHDSALPSGGVVKWGSSEMVKNKEGDADKPEHHQSDSSGYVKIEITTPPKTYEIRQWMEKTPGLSGDDPDFLLYTMGRPHDIDEDHPNIYAQVIIDKLD